MNDLIDGTRVARGTIKIRGVDIYRPDVDVIELRKRVGMVFQKSNPFPKSIYENITYGLRLQGLRDKARLDEIVDCVRRSRAVVITAAPGAGKTTRVPPALLADGPVILLQPRRVAARAIAARIAAERGWTLGREVGWQVRFERRFGADTRLLVVTPGYGCGTPLSLLPLAKNPREAAIVTELGARLRLIRTIDGVDVFAVP